MSDGGKGSKARPLSITQEQYDNRWNYIFQRDKREYEDAKMEDEAFLAIQSQKDIDLTNKKNNTGTDKDEYYDVITTEECLMAIYKDNIS